MKINTIYLFYVFILINTFFKGIGLDNDSEIYLICLILGILILSLKLIKDKYTKRELIFISISIVIGIITFLATKRPTLFLTVLCLIGMKNVSVDDIFKKMFDVRIITFFSVIVLAFIGIIDNTKFEIWRNGEMSTRYALGFGHPNTLHLSLFILIALYIYNRYEKLNIFEYIIMIALNFFIYHFSVSRTGMVGTLILIILCAISKLKFEKIKRIIVRVPKILFIVLFIFSIVTGLLYGKVEFINKLDRIFTGRIAYSNYYLQTYGFSLFGNNIQNDTNALFDNGYLYMYIQFGIVGLLYLSTLFSKIFSIIRKNFDVKKAVLVISFLIYIFTESFSPNIFMNIILLFAAEWIFPNKKLGDETNNGQENNKKLYL